MLLNMNGSATKRALMSVTSFALSIGLRMSSGGKRFIGEVPL